ncbi:hypothetical protein HDC90_002891 [Pedobacter sp. AK013]|nr:hypothetical protein [Pedobacter sp. AK013]
MAISRLVLVSGSDSEVLKSKRPQYPLMAFPYQLTKLV